LIQVFQFERPECSPVAEQRICFCHPSVAHLLTQTQQVYGLLNFHTQPLFTALKTWCQTYASLQITPKNIAVENVLIIWTLDFNKGQAKAVQLCLRDIIGDVHLAV